MMQWVNTPAALLRRQLTHAFDSSRWHVEGLTDDEYFWEPVPRCWSVRPRAAAVSPGPCGRGDWVIDGEWPLSTDPPVTTIAWRVVHLAAWTDVYRDWTFASATESYVTIEVPGELTASVQWLHRAQDSFRTEVDAMDDSDFERERPAHWGQTFPIGALVWQIAVEHLHHGAEIGVIRDLHRGYGRRTPWPTPLATGY